MALRFFLFFAHCRSASTVLHLQPKATFILFIKPNIDPPSTRTRLASAINTRPAGLPLKGGNKVQGHFKDISWTKSKYQGHNLDIFSCDLLIKYTIPPKINFRLIVENDFMHLKFYPFQKPVEQRIALYLSKIIDFPINGLG